MKRLVLFLVVLSFSCVYARQYTKCELFEELKTKFEVKEDEAAKWTCIGGAVANYNTSFYHGDLEYGVLGLFGIQAIFWCASEWDGQVCGVTCDKFVDDDITDDFRCAKDFILKDYEGNFDTWHKFREERCELKWEEIIKECGGEKLVNNSTSEMINDATSPTMSTSSTTTVRTIELEEHVTHEPTTTKITSESPSIKTETSTTTPMTTPEPSTTIPTSISTTKPTQKLLNATLVTFATTELRPVIDNPCTYMSRLQQIFDLNDDQTLTWSCLTLQLIDCHTQRNLNESCFVHCDKISHENCEEFAYVVKNLSKELSKETVFKQTLNLSDCVKNIAFLSDWCLLTRKNDLSGVKIEQNVNNSSQHVYKDEDFSKFSSEEDSNDTDIEVGERIMTIDDKNVTFLTSTSTTEMPVTSTTTVTTISTPKITTTTPETTTRGVFNLTSASILEDPCGSIFFIANNYNLNKSETATWLCVLRDLIFCQYNCQVDCNTAIRYGITNTKYCEELSQTIESVFYAAQGVLAPFFSLVHFSDCQKEIFLFAQGLCPQLAYLKD